MQKQAELYSGKAKTLYATPDPDYVIVKFRDDATAFNGVKKATLSHKGAVNNHFNAYIMQKLANAGISTHFVKILGDDESLMKRLEMIPIECVIRNVTAGSLCRRYGIQEGMALNPPLFEFFLKNDSLGDPMLTDTHIIQFGWATAADLAKMKQLTLAVNQVLKPLFLEAGILLVDYKLEFGRFKDEIVLGDEFTPDGCRLWDVKTKEIFDKDRFRKDLGNVIEGYEKVAQRLGIALPFKVQL